MFKHLMKHRVSIHALYYKIAVESESEYWQQDRQLAELETAAISEDEIDRNLDEQLKAYTRREQAAVIAITFAAMCLEAFFYDYAADHLGDNFTKHHLDKLEIMSSFLVYPKLITGKSPDKGGQAFEGIKVLHQTRNSLVHFKSKSFDLTDMPNASNCHGKLNEKLRKGVQSSIATVELVMKELDSLHGSGEYFSRRLEWSV